MNAGTSEEDSDSDLDAGSGSRKRRADQKHKLQKKRARQDSDESNERDNDDDDDDDDSSSDDGVSNIIIQLPHRSGINFCEIYLISLLKYSICNRDCVSSDAQHCFKLLYSCLIWMGCVLSFLICFDLLEQSSW